MLCSPMAANHAMRYGHKPMMPMPTCWRLSIGAITDHHGRWDAGPFLREARCRLGGALLLLLVALGIAMPPQAIQHHRQGPACTAQRQQPCKAASWLCQP